MFAFFLFLSLHTRVYGNWPAPAYLSAVILIALFFHPEKKLKNMPPSISIDMAQPEKNAEKSVEKNIGITGETAFDIPDGNAEAKKHDTETTEIKELKQEQWRDIWHYGLVTAYLITVVVAVPDSLEHIPAAWKTGQDCKGNSRMGRAWRKCRHDEKIDAIS